MKNNSTNSNLHLQSPGTSLRTINTTACNSTVNQANFSQIRKLNPNMIQTNHRSSLNFSSTNTINRSANRDVFSNSYNFPTRDSIQMSTLKLRRSGSVTAYLPQEINSNISSAITTIGPTIITGTFNNNNITTVNNLRSKFKSNFSPYHSKRHKSNQLSMIDYCNIINLNTNFQMLTNYLESDDPCSKLAIKSNRNGNIQKQTSIAEQMSILFGTTLCNCYLCKMKLAKNAKRHQRHHFEIIPSKNNMDYSIMRYTYSSPYSQLSTLKLFNILNTDCFIHFSSETNSNKINLNGSSSNTNSFNLTNTTISSTNANTNPTSITNSNTQSVSCSATTYPLYSYNPFTTTIIAAAATSNVSNQSSSNLNNTNNATNNNNNSSNVLTLKNLMHVNPNSPPLYDSRYLYLIDCRLNKKHFKKHHIYTSIHYSDLLNDTVYLSPPTDNYTLIVLYDENGRILTNSNGLSSPSLSTSVLNSNNSSRLSNQTFSNDLDDMLELDTMIVKGDEIIKSIRAKLNCVPNQTMYILSGGYEEFYSKFPFMCSNIDIRSTADRNKYLTIYPNCVIENQMYIGSGIQAKNWKIIRDLNITHIINCSIEHECVFQEELAYLHVKLEDNHQENIHKFMVKTLRFIEDAFDKYYEEVFKSENSTDFSIDSGINSATSSKSSNLNTANNSSSSKPIRTPIFLIHCNLGISRSSSILIGYLISKYKLCLYSAFKYVKDKRLQIAPNYSFLKQLKQFEETFL